MRRSELRREFFSKYGLIVCCWSSRSYFGIQDLSDDGNLTRLGNNLIDGISNGAISALMALGYTLVYGIIELIDFAHGEIFMIGAFMAFGMWGMLGLTADTGTAALVVGLLGDAGGGDAGQRLAERDDRTGGLPATYAARRSWRR